MSQKVPEDSDINQPPNQINSSNSTFLSRLALSRHLGSLTSALVIGGITSVILGSVLLIFIPGLRIYSYILLSAGSLLLLTTLIVSFRQVSTAVRGRRGKYSANTAVMVIAFLGIAGVINFVVFENPSRLDVTATKKFTLAPRTLEILSNLDEEITAKAFYSKPISDEEKTFQKQIESMLYEFDVRSTNFSFEFVDPEVDPETTRDYGISLYGTVAFESPSSGRRHNVPPTQFIEQDFVTGLLIVTGKEQKQVFFITGHEERSLTDIEPNSSGLGFAGYAIAGENYAIRNINLSIPEETDALKNAQSGDAVSMLILAAPKVDLSEQELSILDNYLRNGGSMMVLLEPDGPESIKTFLRKWGIEVANGHLIDKERNRNRINQNIALHADQYVPSIPDPQINGILQVSKVTMGLAETYLPGSTALSPTDGVLFFPSDTADQQDVPSSITVVGTALASTSTESWLIEDSSRNDPNDTDKKGFFFPAVAFRAISPVGEPPPEDPSQLSLASLIVFGDSDFASNQNILAVPANKDLFLNSVNWLVGDQALISIRPKLTDPRELILTQNERNFVRYTSWFFLPALLALAGGFVWWRRQ